MKKKYTVFVALLASFILGTAQLPAHAYTEEEKQFVKSMLSAYGYSPDMAGAYQAYMDYLSGMYDDICEQYGLPKQGQGSKTTDPTPFETEAPEPSLSETESPTPVPSENETPKTDPSKEGSETEKPGDENITDPSKKGSDLSETEKDPSGKGTTPSKNGDESKQPKENTTNPQETVENYIELNQPICLEDSYQVTLMEVWADHSIQPSMFQDHDQKYVCEDETYLYIDMVFEVINESAEELEVKELLSLSLHDGETDYGDDLLALLKAEQEGMENADSETAVDPSMAESETNFSEVEQESDDTLLFAEQADGTALSKETKLSPDTQGLFHYAIKVPATSTDLTATIQIEDQTYAFSFSTDNRSHQEEGSQE